MTDSDGSCVLSAVLRDLGSLPERLRLTTEAATAVALAKELDGGQLTSPAPVARQLVALVDQLRRMAKAEEPKGDGVDDLAAARAARRAAAAVSAPAASGDVGGPGSG